MFDNLTEDVIISKILKQVFPFDLAFFLTSKHFYKLLDKYYKHLGIIDTKSKNFIRALSAIMGKTTFFKNKSFERIYVYYDCDLTYNVSVIPFSNDIITTKINHYWDLFIDICKIEITPEKTYWFQNRNNNSFKVQILLLMVHLLAHQQYNFDEYHGKKLHYAIILGMLNHAVDKTLRLDISEYDTPSFYCNIYTPKIVENCADIVNMFYAITGNKRSYVVSYDCTIYYRCDECKSNDSDIFMDSCEHGLLNKQENHKGYVYNFYATPKTRENLNMENCFECTRSVCTQINKSFEMDDKYIL